MSILYRTQCIGSSWYYLSFEGRKMEVKTELSPSEWCHSLDFLDARKPERTECRRENENTNRNVEKEKGFSQEMN